HVLLLLRTAMRQKERGVIGAEDGNALVLLEPAAQPADARGRAEQVLGRARAEAADVLRADEFDRLLKELPAVRRFLRARRAVTRRPAAEDVADEHILALHAARRDDAI